MGWHTPGDSSMGEGSSPSEMGSEDLFEVQEEDQAGGQHEEGRVWDSGWRLMRERLGVGMVFGDYHWEVGGGRQVIWAGQAVAAAAAAGCELRGQMVGRTEGAAEEEQHF